MFDCSSVCEGLYAQVCVRVLLSPKCSLTPQTCPHVNPKHLLRPLFPNCRDINKFSLRRVKNSCCQSISATVPCGSVIHPIQRRRQCKEYKSSSNLTVVLLQQWSHTWVSYRATESTHNTSSFNLIHGVFKKNKIK